MSSGEGGGVMSELICNIFIQYVTLNAFFFMQTCNAVKYVVGTCKHLLKMLSSGNCCDSLLSALNRASACFRCEKVHAVLKKGDLVLKLTGYWMLPFLKILNAIKAHYFLNSHPTEQWFCNIARSISY